MEDKELAESMQKLLIVMQRLDHKIAPLLDSDGGLFNTRFYLCLLGQSLTWMACGYCFKGLNNGSYLVSGGVFSREQAYGTKAT